MKLCKDCKYSYSNNVHGKVEVLCTHPASVVAVNLYSGEKTYRTFQQMRFEKCFDAKLFEQKPSLFERLFNVKQKS